MIEKEPEITKTELLTTLKQKNNQLKKVEKKLEKLEEAFKA